MVCYNRRVKGMIAMTKCYISTILNGNKNYQIIKETCEKADFTIGLEYFISALTDPKIRELQALQSDIGSRPATFHSPMVDCESTSEIGSDAYQKMIQNWLRTIDFCHRYGCNEIVFHTNNCYIHPEERIQKQKNAIENALTLHQLCNENKIKMLVETLALPIKGAPLFTDREFVKFILDYDLYALIDIGHMNINGYDYSYVIENLNKHILGYHIHNNNQISDDHQRIGSGTFNYNTFYEYYKKYTPDANIVMEYFNIPNFTSDDLLADIKELLTKIKE